MLDKVEKWISGCEKKVYGPFMRVCHVDRNRYNASRDAHLNLERAEKARILVNKIPALVDSLVAKTRAWEEKHELTFACDGVSHLVMLDEYALLRHDREEEKRDEGQGKGFDIDLIKLISDAVSIPVIASSGAGTVEHFSEVFNLTNASAALAAGIFHRKEVPVQSVKAHLLKEGIEVRM